MDHSTSVPRGMGEQSLTPGEQRILALMEQGQQRLEQGQQRLEQRMDRMDQRLHSLEEGQKRTDKQLTELTLTVDQEAAASRMRDRELSASLERMQEDARQRNLWLVDEIKRTQKSTLEVMYLEMGSFRAAISERLNQHDTHLGVVKQTFERHEAHLREHGQAIAGLQQEMRKLTAAVEHLARAPGMAATQ